MAVDFQAVVSSPSGAYAEGLNYFHGVGIMNNALKRLAADLDSKDIDYVVIGAVALNNHGYRRFTEDIDLLLTRDGLERFRDTLVGLGYRPAFEGALKKFRTSEENVPVEMITAGEYPGDGLPKPVVFPDPKKFAVDIDGIKTVTLEKLIELKLASGMTAPDRLRDLADVQEMIKIKGLDEAFADKLDEYVRAKFLELYNSVAASRSADRDDPSQRGHVS
jgi:hypothetical protein